MVRRWPVEEIIRLHVLADNHQHAAVAAKDGRVSAARVELKALDAMTLVEDPEVRAVYRMSSLPAWALVCWKEGNPDKAVDCLHDALHACTELSSRFGHDYLTAKRIHLAANIARVHVSNHALPQALQEVARLRAVIDGNREQWPFDDGESLVVPLHGVERQTLEAQLERIVARAATDPIEATVRAAIAEGLFKRWSFMAEGKDGEIWWEFRPIDMVIADRGQKIHLSASSESAAEVLARAIPILVRMRVPFKHAPSIARLTFLSSGKGGLTQVGKFLSAYPRDADTARELSASLHEATRDLTGPQILADTAYCAGSLVHYRHGSFARHWLQLRTGRIVPALLGENGVLEPDRRDVPTPEGTDRSGSSMLLRSRYLRIQEIHRGPKGSTWLGFAPEVSTAEALLVIKQAYAYVMEAGDGLDAKRRLRREAHCLEALAGTGVCPSIVDFWAEERCSFLVYELIEGPTLESVLHALAGQGLRPTYPVLFDWAIALCNLVAAVHEQGIVIADIKPSNLIVTENGLRLIDLELAGEPTTEPVGSMGTEGYASPQQADPNRGRSFLDDVYSIGATLLAAATVTDSSLLPDPLLVVQIERTHDPQNPIYTTIEGCLARDPAQRLQSPKAVASQLSAPPLPKPEGPWTSIDFAQLALMVGDRLIACAVHDNQYRWWVSDHPIVGGNAGRDLYAGSAGTALFLCALFEKTGNWKYLDTAKRCGEWLFESKETVQRQDPMPGLYFGVCGAGLLYLRLYMATGVGEWLDRAMAVGREAARMPTHSPDLLTGVAGTGLFHLALWEVTRDAAVLGRAVEAAHSLLLDRSPERPSWVIPPGHEGLSGNEYLGFAHGASGIAYFLAQCALTFRDLNATHTVVEVADWMLLLAKPCGADSRGLTWGATLDDEPHAINWCHGSPGILRFLLAAHEVSGNPEYLDAAQRVGHLLEVTAAWTGTTQCHGLAGNAEALIDLSQRTDRQRHLASARRLGENLASYRTPGGWPSEDRRVVTPDLMVGEAGIGAAFLRLACPEMPHLISMKWFIDRQGATNAKF
ncbi:MAG: hypothetical protein QOC81_1205 [Thermoanaerobaculia bacterium]|nr:hypothetical protein [Thermoanaerobaculia bacterium]